MEPQTFTDIQRPKSACFNERFAHLVLLSSGGNLRRVDQQPRFKLISQLLAKYVARVKELSGADVSLEHLTINNTLAKRFFNKASPIFWMVQIAAKYYPTGDTVFGKSTVSTRSWTDPFTREAIEHSKLIWDECLPEAILFTIDILNLAIEAADNQNVETPYAERDQLPTPAELTNSLQYLSNFVGQIGDRQPIDSVAIGGEKPRAPSKKPTPKTKVSAKKRHRHVVDDDDADEVDVESLTCTRSAINKTCSDLELILAEENVPQPSSKRAAPRTSKNQTHSPEPKKTYAPYTQRLIEETPTPVVDNQILGRLATLQDTVNMIMQRLEYTKKSASPNTSNFFPGLSIIIKLILIHFFLR